MSAFSHVLRLSRRAGLLVSYRPLAPALGRSIPSTEIVSILQVALLGGVRESTPGRVQSALAYLCCRVRAAEESPGPFAYIFAYRKDPTQIVDCWVGSHAYE